MTPKKPAARRPAATPAPSLQGRTTELKIDDAGRVLDVTPPTAWETAGRIGAGLAIVATALTAWAFTFVLGGRPAIDSLLHREAGGITLFEISFAGLFAFGSLFIIGLGWSFGTRTGKK